MTEPQKAGATPGLTVADVLYIVFKHKWKIVVMACLGVAGAFAVRAVVPKIYESEAKLYISYVLESKAPTSVGENAPSSMAGEMVINTELEILKSRDLAQQVADDVGPEAILGKGGTNGFKAAEVIQKSLVAQVTPNARVIRLAFQHPNPKIVQPVLTRLISFYFIKHNEIHSPEAIDDFLTKETESLRKSLHNTEEALRAAKAKVGIISLDEDKKGYTEQISRIRQEILDAEADLASRQASLVALAIALPSGAEHGSGGLTNQSAVTNVTVLPAAITRQYRNLLSTLDGLRKREQSDLQIFTPESSPIRELRKQIEQKEAAKQALEKEYPSLQESAPVVTMNVNGPSEQPVAPRMDFISARSAVAGLEAKIAKLTEQLDKISKQANTVDAAEDSILELQRRKDSDETYYKHFLEKLAQVQLEKKASAEKVSIRPVQLPSPPVSAPSKRMKMELGALVGGLAAGLGLAFLLEMFLDQSVRRPVDIETKVQLPLFMTIPQLRINGKRTALGGKKIRLLSGPGQSSDSANGVTSSALQRGSNSSSDGDLAAWDPRHLLRPFSEALRDRLITYFEIKNLTHKPKLIAVTACGKNAGVSTVAAGLAASLSETGEGNVLLVDMNVENGSARHFRRGDLACDIDDVLETGKRENAQVQDNLYVVTESSEGEQMPSILPKRFKNLVPKLKASDFDYIIFDMPPVSQISVTPRLAKFMDITLMVVESEKTNYHIVKRASTLLSESKAHVGIVLNKLPKYIPERLQQET
jgi:succinoglycan biosynthesis transport protein ExoP